MLVSDLGAAEQGQAGLGGQRPACPVDPQGGVGPGVTAEILDQCAELIQGGQLLAAQGADRLPRIGQPGLGQLGRPVDGGAQGLADRLLAGEGLRAPWSWIARPDSEWASTSCSSPAMRLRSASAAAAASASRASWSWASSSSVRSWLWRPRRMHRPRHREQQAQQHRGDGRLGGRLLGQADGHGQRGRDRPGGDRGRHGLATGPRRSRRRGWPPPRPGRAAARRPAPPRSRRSAR